MFLGFLLKLHCEDCNRVLIDPTTTIQLLIQYTCLGFDINVIFTETKQVCIYDCGFQTRKHLTMKMISCSIVLLSQNY